MKLIAHRGLLNGPDKNLENTPEQINFALKSGYDVEIDVWAIAGRWYLGHDIPGPEVYPSFLHHKGMWIHCKNLEALYALSNSYVYENYFWHDSDDFTLTSSGYIWTYPGKELTPRSIEVLPERGKTVREWLEMMETYRKHKHIYTHYGICSDYVSLIDM